MNKVNKIFIFCLMQIIICVSVSEALTGENYIFLANDYVQTQTLSPFIQIDKKTLWDSFLNSGFLDTQNNKEDKILVALGSQNIQIELSELLGLTFEQELTPEAFQSSIIQVINKLPQTRLSRQQLITIISSISNLLISSGKINPGQIQELAQMVERLGNEYSVEGYKKPSYIDQAVNRMQLLLEVKVDQMGNRYEFIPDIRKSSKDMTNIYLVRDGALMFQIHKMLNRLEDSTIPAELFYLSRDTIGAQFYGRVQELIEYTRLETAKEIAEQTGNNDVDFSSLEVYQRFKINLFKIFNEQMDQQDLNELEKMGLTSEVEVRKEFMEKIDEVAKLVEMYNLPEYGKLRFIDTGTTGTMNLLLDFVIQNKFSESQAQIESLLYVSQLGQGYLHSEEMIEKFLGYEKKYGEPATVLAIEADEFMPVEFSRNKEKPYLKVTDSPKIMLLSLLNTLVVWDGVQEYVAKQKKTDVVLSSGSNFAQQLLGLANPRENFIQESI